MNARAVTVQGGLALAGLVAAYFTWQRQPELAAGEVFAFDVTRNDLETVRYGDDEVKNWAELSRGKDSNGALTWVRLSGVDATAVAFPSGHPYVPTKVPERLVRGNESAERVFESFAPLRATRALGVLDAGLLKDLGLDVTKKFIEVTARGNKRRFAIVPAPPGGNDPYIRDAADGRVYIIARHLMSDLQAASINLVERRLHSFRMEDVDRIEIAAAGKKREFIATRNDDSLPGVRLAPREAPDKPDQTAKNWHDRVFNLFPSEVLGKDELPPPAAPVVAIRLAYSSRGRALGWMELARAGTATAAVSTVDPPQQSSEIFGRSDFSAGWTKLPADAAALISEGETLLRRK